MSTRSMIIVKNAFAEVKLYHHCDGYPEGVGLDLMSRFYKKLEEVKDMQKADVDVIANELVKDTNDRYEITIFNHIDIEYEYIIDCDLCKILCFEIRKDWDTGLTMERKKIDLEKLYNEQQ